MTTRTRKEKAAQHHLDGQSPIEVKHLLMVQHQQQTAQLADTLLQGFEGSPLELAKFLASQHPDTMRSMRLQRFEDPYKLCRRNNPHRRITLLEESWVWLEHTLLDAMLLGDQHYTGGWLASDLLKIGSELELVRNRFRVSGGGLEEPIGVVDAPEEQFRGITITVGLYYSIAWNEDLLPSGSVDHFKVTGVDLPQFFNQITHQLPGKPDFLWWACQ